MTDEQGIPSTSCVFALVLVYVKKHMSHEKKSLLSINESWLIYWDPHFMVHQNFHVTV